MLSALVSGGLGYLLGSIPAAFLLVRWKSHLDIRSQGSGNVGTLNSYQVSGSKGIAAMVLGVDFFKGLAAVYLAGALWPENIANAAWAGTGAVLGHNFPVWLRFKGGRGLATGAGALLPFGWVTVVVWVIAWFVGFRLLRRVNPANAIASVFLMLVLAVLPAELLEAGLKTGVPSGLYRTYSMGVLVIILVKHIQPFREYLREKRQGSQP